MTLAYLIHCLHNEDLRWQKRGEAMNLTCVQWVCKIVDEAKGTNLYDELMKKRGELLK